MDTSFLSGSSSASGYRQYSEYSREPGGITRLDSVVAAVERRRALSFGMPRDSFPIVEIGCGCGNLSIPIASLGYPVVGVDIDRPSIQEATRRCPFPGARFLVADPGELEAGAYRVAILSEVLEHLTDPLDLLSKTHALLAPSGSLIVTVPNGYGPWELMNHAQRLARKLGIGDALSRLKKALGYTGHSLQSKNPNLEHVRWFTRSRLLALLSCARFTLARFEALSFVVGAFPVSWLFRQWPGIEEFDRATARLLPVALVSGWLLELTREE